MKLPSITAALAAALFLAASPLAASAAELTPAPIQVHDKPIVQEDGFRNERDTSTTDKAFVLEDHGGRLIERVEHFGCYGEGVNVRHDFTDIESGDNQDVTVEKAPFADGNVWETVAGC
jgi:hypothetical protein